jgi:hypothetical protein
MECSARKYLAEILGGEDPFDSTTSLSRFLEAAEALRRPGVSTKAFAGSTGDNGRAGPQENHAPLPIP